MASIRYRSDRKTWQLDWRENGERKRTLLGQVTKKQAEVALKKKERELFYADNSYRPLTIKDFAPTYLDWHENQNPDSNKNIRGVFKNKILPEFGALQLAKLDPIKVEAWKHKLHKEKGFAAESVNKWLRTLKAMIHRAVKLNLIPKSTIDVVEDVKTKASQPFNYFSVDDLKKLYEVAKEYQYVWKLMVNTGMRRAEALQLKWEHVQKNQIQIISTEQDRTKSGKWRSIPINPVIRECLKELKKRWDETYVIPHVHPQSLSRAFERDAKRANLSGSIHDLRHTFCSHLVMNKTPLRTVQVLAGHSSVMVTERYAHLSPEHLADAMRMLKL